MLIKGALGFFFLPGQVATFPETVQYNIYKHSTLKQFSVQKGNLKTIGGGLNPQNLSLGTLPIPMATCKWCFCCSTVCTYNEIAKWAKYRRRRLILYTCSGDDVRSHAFGNNGVESPTESRDVCWKHIIATIQSVAFISIFHAQYQKYTTSC